MKVRGKFFDFLDRFVAKGGDVTKLKYSFGLREQGGLRSIISYSYKELRVVSEGRPATGMYVATGALRNENWDMEVLPVHCAILVNNPSHVVVNLIRWD